MEGKVFMLPYLGLTLQGVQGASPEQLRGRSWKFLGTPPERLQVLPPDIQGQFLCSRVSPERYPGASPEIPWRANQYCESTDAHDVQ